MRTLIALYLLACSILPGASRLKDLVTVEGVRDNQVMGYGLVVGLAGTGDRRQTRFSAQTLTNLLDRMGVTVPPAAIQVSNTAAVMVTSILPPFAQPGTHIDITVAAIGDARNLQGGLLLLTPLKGGNGETYAVAQGQVVTGGFIAGNRGNTQTVNHPTAGRVPNGAIVERMAPSILSETELRLQLRQADFTSAARIAKALNDRFNGTVARAPNPAVVTVAIPPAYMGRAVEFLADAEEVAIETDTRAKIVINERTGTIVVGKDVTIQPAAILHGSLSVEITTSFDVSQPEALSGGDTRTIPRVGVGVKADPARHIALKKGTNVDELVRSLQAVGSTPRDIIAILQALKTAGSLQAEIEVI